MSELDQPGMRAGHADREQVVSRLNTAFAEGRLEVRELEERVSAAYAAKTLGELVPLTADLPAGSRPAPRPVPAPAPAPAPAPKAHPRPYPLAPPEPSIIDWTPIGGGLALFLLNLLIWAIISISTGDLIYFWPIWTAIPLVLAVVGTAASRKGR